MTKKIKIEIVNNDLLVSINSNTHKLNNINGNTTLLQFLEKIKVLPIECIELPLVDGSLEKLATISSLKKIKTNFMYTNLNSFQNGIQKINCNIQINVLDRKDANQIFTILNTNNFNFKYNSNDHSFKIKKVQNGGLGFIMPIVNKKTQKIVKK